MVAARELGYAPTVWLPIPHVNVQFRTHVVSGRELSSRSVLIFHLHVPARNSQSSISWRGTVRFGDTTIARSPNESQRYRAHLRGP